MRQPSGGAAVTGGLNVSGNIALPDSSIFIAGAGDDLQIYHNGTNSYLRNSTGIMHVGGSGGDLLLEALGDVRTVTWEGENMIYAKRNGEVELYYDNNLRLETTSAGVDISGSSDGVLNLNTTDGRGSFIRFQENGSSKGFVGCAEGLGLGDQDDISLRATDRVFIQTGGASETKRLDRDWETKPFELPFS